MIVLFAKIFCTSLIAIVAFTLLAKVFECINEKIENFFIVLLITLFATIFVSLMVMGLIAIWG